MGDVIFSVKISRELKERMERYRGRVDWAEEVRRFLEERVRQLEAEENVRRIAEALRSAPWSVPKGHAEELVREDRDSH